MISINKASLTCTLLLTFQHFICCSAFPLNSNKATGALSLNDLFLAPSTPSKISNISSKFSRRLRTARFHMTSTNNQENQSFPLQMSQVELPNGTKAEVISSFTASSKSQKEKPTLIFIHGSFHAAWCWAEHYLPFFASHGYDATALSLRGTGGTFAGENVKKVKIMEHVNDLNAFLEYIENVNDGPKQKLQKPVLIAHSFGGLAVMKYLESSYTNNAPRDLISGTALFCSVPPSGNGKMTLRFLRESLRNSWKITAGLAMKKCITDSDLCRDLFFSTKDDPTGGISDEDINRFQSYFARDTVAIINLGDLAKQLPSAACDSNGQAPFVTQSNFVPALVVGAQDDFIVDKVGVEETATYFGLQSPTFIDSAHDVMLGSKWRNGAEVLLKWLYDEVMVQ